MVGTPIKFIYRTDMLGDFLFYKKPTLRRDANFCQGVCDQDL